MPLIKVTQEDIEEGIPEDPCYCPVALALGRVYPKCNVLVHEDSFFIDGKIYDAPANVIEFISDFDFGEEVDPFTFAFND